ncbi:hypothetical protein GCM10009109_11040 [Marinobacterium sediminicola]
MLSPERPPLWLWCCCRIMSKILAKRLLPDSWRLVSEVLVAELWVAEAVRTMLQQVQVL